MSSSGLGSTAYLSALDATAQDQPSLCQLHHNPTSALNTSTSHLPINLTLPPQPAAHHNPRGSTLAARPALGETSHNANQTPPNTKTLLEADNEDEHLHQTGRYTTKQSAKLEQHKKNRAVREAARDAERGRRRSRTSETPDTESPVEGQMKYKQYREKQKKPTNRPPVWDEELERAFMEAIQAIPKIGRKKLTHGGKPKGRNELIADYIYKVTGIVRTRKQVSSHIQVLKGMLNQNQNFMEHVTSGDPQDQDAEDPIWDIKMEERSPTAYSEPTPSLDNRPLPPRRANTSGSSLDEFRGFDSPPLSACQSLFQVPLSSMVPVTFEMRAGRTDESGHVESCFHIYTSLSHNEPTQNAVSLTALRDWKKRFPYVSSLFSNNELGPHCSISQVSASISTLSGTPPSNSLLWTQLEVPVPATATLDHCEWECATRIYAPGKGPGEPYNQVWLRVQVASETEGSLDGIRRLALPFASDFWSAFYTELSATQSKIREAENIGESETLRRSQKREAEAIGGITVVQEIFSTSVIAGRERVALLLWDFTKADHGYPGRAMCREIIAPTSSSSSCSISSSASSASQPAALPIPTSVPLMFGSHTQATSDFLVDTMLDTKAPVTAAGDEVWNSQYPQNAPISPFEELPPDGLSPYYPFDRAMTTTAFSVSTADAQGLLAAADMNINFFPQSSASSQAYAPYANADASLDHFLGPGGAAGVTSGGWPQQRQQHHLSPVSMVEEGQEGTSGY